MSISAWPVNSYLSPPLYGSWVLSEMLVLWSLIRRESCEESAGEVDVELCPNLLMRIPLTAR